MSAYLLTLSPDISMFVASNVRHLLTWEDAAENNAHALLPHVRAFPQDLLESNRFAGLVRCVSFWAFRIVPYARALQLFSHVLYVCHTLWPSGLQRLADWREGPRKLWAPQVHKDSFDVSKTIQRHGEHALAWL
jgi:hypothetical protein